MTGVQTGVLVYEYYYGGIRLRRQYIQNPDGSVLVSSRAEKGFITLEQFMSTKKTSLLSREFFPELRPQDDTDDTEGS